MVFVTMTIQIICVIVNVMEVGKGGPQMKAEFESAEVLVPDARCMYCEKNVGKWTAYKLLGWVRWKEEYKNKKGQLYYITYKSPIQIHEKCVEFARVDPETD